jgi:hypothetical protein
MVRKEYVLLDTVRFLFDSYTPPMRFLCRGAASVVLPAYRGVDTSAPVDVSNGLAGSASRTVTAPSVTTTRADTLLVGLFGIRTNATLAVPGSMIKQGEAVQSGGSDKLTLTIADEHRAAAGATGTAHRRGLLGWRVPYLTEVIRSQPRPVQIGAWGALSAVIFDHLVTGRVFR